MPFLHFIVLSFLSLSSAIALAEEVTDLNFTSPTGVIRKIESVTITRKEAYSPATPSPISGWLQWVDVKIVAQVEVASKTDVKQLLLQNDVEIEQPPGAPASSESQNFSHALSLVRSNARSISAGSSHGQLVLSTKEALVSFNVALVWGAYGRFSGVDRNMTFYLGKDRQTAPVVRAIVNQKTGKVDVSFTNP